jgi:hypothetical protein
MQLVFYGYFLHATFFAKVEKEQYENTTEVEKVTLKKIFVLHIYNVRSYIT